jgi:hypothetical protein
MLLLYWTETPESGALSKIQSRLIRHPPDSCNSWAELGCSADWKKGNLSASGLNKLTYYILKHEKDDATDLMVKVMTMMLRIQKCPESWKEDKVVMLPKPCNENQKGRPENWMPITLTNIFYKIIFGRISEYFQSIQKRKTIDGDGIVRKDQIFNSRCNEK